jgi:hypothetical protein
MTTSTTTPAAKTAVKAAPKVKDYKSYATKAPTSLHQHYTTWLSQKTGITVTAETVKVVQLAVTLYHDYQASAENVQRRAVEATERNINSGSAKTPEQIAAQIVKLQAQLDAAKATPATPATPANGTKTPAKAPVAAAKK